MRLLRKNNVKCRIMEVTFRDDSILEIIICKDEEFEMADAQQLIDIAEELGEGKKLNHLYLFGPRTIPTQSARELLCSEIGSQFKHKEAYVVTSLSQKMIFNFMLNVERPTVEAKLFTSKEKAIAWLQV